MTKTDQIMEQIEKYGDASWESGHFGDVGSDIDAAMRFDALKSAIEELVKDAARYQWLRKMDAEEWDSFFGGMRRDCNMKMLDVTIDEAMEKAP